MNVWLVNPFSDLPDEGATEGRFCCLARLLAETGHSVTWWTVDFHHRTKRRREAPTDGEWRMADGGAFEIVLLPVPAYRKNISLARLRSHRAYGREFAKEAGERIAGDPEAVPDVIHLSAPPLDCIDPALELKRRYGCRVTVDVMDLWPETFSRLVPGDGGLRMADGELDQGITDWTEVPGWRGWLVRRLFGGMFRTARRGYREADGVSAVSQEYLDLVAKIRRTPSPPTQSCLAPGAKHGSAITHPPSSLHLCYVGGELIEAAPRASRAEADGPRFIYVGAMSPTYDLQTILEASSILKDEGRSFEVSFAGCGVSEAALRAEVRRLGLEDRVRFLGFLNRDALADALGDADVGLNAIKPGTFITMPHKLSDYFCAGLAVINSTPGEPEALLAEAQAGVTYEAGSAKGLAAAMRSYLENPKMLEAHRKNSWRLAETRFARDASYRRLIEWILATPGGS